MASSSTRTRKTSLGRRPAGFDLGTDAGAGTSAGGSSSRSSARHDYPGTPSSSSARRQALLYGPQEDRVVLDIGTRCTKVGFAGEARPRMVLDSVKTATRASESLPHDGYGREAQDDICLWGPDILHCRDQEERSKRKARLSARLTLLLREVYITHLMIEPKSRGVILVESPLMPNVVRKTLCDVLFGNLQVPSISFMPAHLLSTLAVGRMAGLVIDMGHHEATLVPVHSGRPMVPQHLRTTPRAGKRLQARLKSLLLHFGHYYPPFTPSSGSSFGQGSASSSLASGAGPSRRTKIPERMLTEGFLQDISAKALLVGNPVKDQDVQVALDGSDDEEAYIQQLAERYGSEGIQATDLTIQVPASSRPPIHPPQQPSTLSLATVQTAREARGSLVVPGWIRERACEVFFEPGDEDEASIVEMVLESLVKLPIDTRPALAGSILIVGGTAMIPNFAHRLRIEVVRALAKADQSLDGAVPSVALSMARVGPRWDSVKVSKQKEATSASLVAAAAEAAEGDESFQSAHEGDEEAPAAADESYVTTAANEQQSDEEQFEELRRSTSSMSLVERKRYHRFAPLSSLAHHVAVLNDHAPRIASDGLAVGGTAPSLPLQLVPWIGASLIGSLRSVDSAQVVLREAWDQAQADQREIVAKSARQGQPQKDVELPTSPTPSSSFASRPGYGAQRGSFLGVVHGLDLGSYGPLSAKQRFGSGLGSPPAPSSSSSMGR